MEIEAEFNFLFFRYQIKAKTIQKIKEAKGVQKKISINFENAQNKLEPQTKHKTCYAHIEKCMNMCVVHCAV